MYVRSERAEVFHRLLEDMANDIMENGPRAPVAESWESSPQSSPRSPRMAPVAPLQAAEFAEPLLQAHLPPALDHMDEVHKPQEPVELEQSGSESADESVPD